jgi:hypothetical protein
MAEQPTGAPLKYRKKPVLIEATQWFRIGDHPNVRQYDQGDAIWPTPCRHCHQQPYRHGSISTLEGEHIVCPGDQIITGVMGEQYPCKPDIFALTYEKAEETG